MIENYLEDQLLKTAIGNKPNTLSNLHWKGSKTALTELIYALHSQGIFNNGDADIKPIVKVFESTFNVDLGDFYHTFLELKSREINRTKFLDSLKETLIRKMDETGREIAVVLLVLYEKGFVSPFFFSRNPQQGVKCLFVFEKQIFCIFAMS